MRDAVGVALLLIGGAVAMDSDLKTESRVALSGAEAMTAFLGSLDLNDHPLAEAEGHHKTPKPKWRRPARGPPPPRTRRLLPLSKSSTLSRAKQHSSPQEGALQGLAKDVQGEAMQEVPRTEGSRGLSAEGALQGLIKDVHGDAVQQTPSTEGSGEWKVSAEGRMQGSSKDAHGEAVTDVVGMIYNAKVLSTAAMSTAFGTVVLSTTMRTASIFLDSKRQLQVRWSTMAWSAVEFLQYVHIMHRVGHGSVHRLWDEAACRLNMVNLLPRKCSSGSTRDLPKLSCWDSNQLVQSLLCLPHEVVQLYINEAVPDTLAILAAAAALLAVILIPLILICSILLGFGVHSAADVGRKTASSAFSQLLVMIYTGLAYSAIGDIMSLYDSMEQPHTKLKAVTGGVVFFMMLLVPTVLWAKDVEVLHVSGGFVLFLPLRALVASACFLGTSTITNPLSGSSNSIAWLVASGFFIGFGLLAALLRKTRDGATFPPQDRPLLILKAVGEISIVAILIALVNGSARSPTEPSWSATRDILSNTLLIVCACVLLLLTALYLVLVCIPAMRHMCGAASACSAPSCDLSERSVHDLLSLTMMHEVFLKSVQSNPDGIAIEHVEVNQRYTYAEANARSGRLAHYLRHTCNIGRGSIVGVHLPRCCDMYIAQLAILKAGGVYLPMDEELPRDRIEYMLSDSKAQTVISNTAKKSALTAVSSAVFLDQIHFGANAQGARYVADDVTPQDPAYIIYTSGTTGRPKGVCIAHQNVLVYITGLLPLYGVTTMDRVLQGFSVSSDASIEEIWTAFLEGATLVVGTKQTMVAMDELAINLQKLRISVFSTVPTVLSMCDLSTASIPGLKLVITGGEAIRSDTIKKWWSPTRKVMNTYGPTECSVVATYCECFPDTVVEIGAPVPGYTLVILDNDLQPIASTDDESWQRESREGELGIGGPAVSTYGYLNRPDLNAEKFVTNKNGMRVYRSGDLVKLDRDGKLIFLGRIDDQVKIRGFRVELGEIESALCEELKNDVIIAYRGDKEDSTEASQSPDKIVVAYIIMDNGPDSGSPMMQRDRYDAMCARVRASKDALRKRLPVYMMPSKFLCLPISLIRRNTGGKVDKKRLPPFNELQEIQLVTQDEIDAMQAAAVSTTEGNDTEAGLVQIWTRVLQTSVGVDEDFVQLGGNSQLAAQVVSQCRKELGMQNVTVRDLYSCKTVRALAAKCTPISETALQQALFQIWSTVLGTAIKLDDDFVALGGNSQLAAQIISSCQRQAGLEGLSVRDLYDAKTIRALCARALSVQRVNGGASTSKAPELVSAATYFCVGLCQTLFLMLLLAGASALFIAEFSLANWIFQSVSPGNSSNMALFMGVILLMIVFQPLITLPVEFLLACLTKWIFVGRFTEMECLVWSFKYLQWWIATLLMGPLKTQVGVLFGTQFASMLYRLMGAKIGTNVQLYTVLDDWDLVQIGSNTTISHGSMLRTHYFKDGKLFLRKVLIGEGVYVGEQCVIGGGAVVPDGCKILSMTSIIADHKLVAGAAMRGNPATEVTADDETGNEYVNVLKKHEDLNTVRCGDQSAAFSCLQVLCAGLLQVLMTVWTMAPELMLYAFSSTIGNWAMTLDLRYLIPFSFAMGFMGFWFELLGFILCKYLLLGRASDATVAQSSTAFLQHELRMQLLAKLSQPGDLRPVTETRMMSWVLRALGAEIGTDCEISTGEYEPDLLKMGDYCMFADKVHIGRGITHAGHYTNATRSFGSRVFVGNDALISPIAKEVPNDTTIGNMTFAPARSKTFNIYLGSPSFAMPCPVTSEATTDDFKPQPWYNDLARGLHNLCKIAVPRGISESMLWILLKCLYAVCGQSGAVLGQDFVCLDVWWWAPAIFLGSAVVYALLPIVHKWLLTGVYGSLWLLCLIPARSHQMWSAWLWRDEIHYEVSQMIDEQVHPFISGTPWKAWYYALQGARFGSRPLLSSTSSLMEYDLVTVGDNFLCEGTLQTHSFEGRNYQLGDIKIGNNCSVGAMSIILKGQLEDGVSVGDLSLVMKDEVCLAGMNYSGMPAQVVL